MDGGTAARVECPVTTAAALQSSSSSTSMSSTGTSSSARSSQSPSTQSQQRPVMSVRVIAETNEGNRPHMEDVTCCVFDNSRPGGQAFLAVFDGHGGRQAALYAKEHLWENMLQQEGFNSDDHSKVEDAMREAFRITQSGMEEVVGTWPRARYGLPSTSGTTASIVILRGRTMYTAHLGDSGIVLAKRRQPAADDGTPSEEEEEDSGVPSSNGMEDEIEAVQLTVDHKPDTEAERQSIERRGGKVRSGTRGVSRVVWRRKRPVSGHTVVNMSHNELTVEEIPFLGVARSLGDLWSYNADIGEYIVSCQPDVAHRTISVTEDLFLVMASDGLWNVLTPREVVEWVAQHTHITGQKQGRLTSAAASGDSAGSDSQDSAAQSDDVCHNLIKETLRCWRDRKQRADNISVIVAFFNKPLSTQNANTPIFDTQQSSRTATPILGDVDPPSAPMRERQPSNSAILVNAVAAAVHGDVVAATATAAAAQAGDVSSSEESSSSSEDATPAPQLRRATRVQHSANLAAIAAAASMIDTPSSEEHSSPSKNSPKRHHHARRSAPAVLSAVVSETRSTRAAKRKSANAAESPAKRLLRSSPGSRGEKTPLQEDAVSSSGDDV